ncbi:hypothetical protein NLJ89_g4106 [Agrocybe chaxingu]|uniref:Uncharacterized protein n=1 Tax=Agrocybe chaxingu TaxID=84603 RepID=A0A9W8MUW0_9AGAR|nr:hypothetical protein NLJ89_g4106 [Agrocybe chaxingu]
MYFTDNQDDAQFALNYVALRAQFNLRVIALKADLDATTFRRWKEDQNKELKVATFVYGLCKLNEWDVQLDPIIRGLSRLFVEDFSWDDAPQERLQELLFDTQPHVRYRPGPSDNCSDLRSWWENLESSIQPTPVWAFAGTNNTAGSSGNSRGGEREIIYVGVLQQKFQPALNMNMQALQLGPEVAVTKPSPAPSRFKKRPSRVDDMSTQALPPPR